MSAWPAMLAQANELIGRWLLLSCVVSVLGLGIMGTVPSSLAHHPEHATEDDDDDDDDCGDGEPTCPINGGDQPPDDCSAGSSGNPVRYWSGEKHLHKSFLSLPGPLNMTVSLSYRSNMDIHSPVGYGWTHGYNWRLYPVMDPGHPFLIRRGSGIRTKFEPSSSLPTNQFISVDRRHEILEAHQDGTFTLRRKNHEKLTFDEEGRLTSIADGKGASLRFTYAEGGPRPISGRSRFTNLANIMVVAREYLLQRADEFIGDEATGRFYVYSYDATGHLTNVMDHASRVITLAYNAEGELLNITDPLGTSYGFEYDQEPGLLTAYTGTGCGECSMWRNQYDSQGRVTNQVQGVDGNGTEVSIAYLPDATRATFRVKDQNGAVIRTREEYLNFMVDVLGQTRVASKRVTLDDGTVSTNVFGYDEMANLVTNIINGRATNSWVYDERRNVVAARRHVSGNIYLVYTNIFDDENNLIERRVYQTDRTNEIFVTRYEYDDAQRRTKERQSIASGVEAVRQWIYNERGLVEEEIDPNGNRMAFEYNPMGYRIREFDPDNPDFETEYQFDLIGNITNLTDALGRTWSYQYDALGRRIHAVDSIGREEIWTFAGPNLVRHEVGRVAATPGRVMRYEYNGLNQQVGAYRLDDAGQTQLWKAVVYDTEGKVLAESDATGHTISHVYDKGGRQIARLEHGIGALTQYRYDAWGNVTQTVNAVGVATRMQYDLLGRLTSRVEAVGLAEQRTTAFRYNALDQQVQIVHPDGSSAHYVFDGAGRVISIAGTREVAMAYAYDLNGKLIAATDANGRTTTNVYDAYSRLVAVVHPGGDREESEYDLVGQLVAQTDARSNTVHFAYDNAGRLMRRSAPNDTNTWLETFEYNAWDQVVARSNAAGGVFRAFHDRLGRVTNTVDEAGLSLVFVYDAADRLVSTLWPNGRSISNVYEHARLVATVDRAGLTNRFVYDLLGRRVESTDSLGGATRFAYDGLNRQVAVTNALGHATRIAYDLFGQAVEIEHADGNIEHRRYDDWGRLTNQFGAGQYPIVYQYDAVGNLTNMIDGNGRRTAWGFDGRNRQVRKTYDDGSFYEYAYDGNGNLVRRLDALGRETLYEYDEQNLLIATMYQTDSPILFGYDLMGRRTNMVDGLGTNRWAYDPANRLVEYEQTYTGTLLEYEYDEEGRRISFKVNGEQTAYAYDPAGRLTAVSNEAGAFTYAWHPQAHLIASLAFPSGALVSNAYDVLQRLTGKFNLNATGGVVSSFQYGYDAVNLRTNQVHGDGSGRSYAYDDIRQLIGAQGFDSGGGADTNFVYQYWYDSIGNYTQTARQGMTEMYGPNNLNQYTNRVRITNGGATNEFRYDANGNLLYDGTLNYAWDEENRLIMVSNETWHTEFVYDGLWRRVETREYTNGSLAFVKRHVYDGWLPVVELNETNGLVSAMTWGLDLSLTLEGAGGIGGLLADLRPLTSDILFFYYDGNGNVVDVLDDADSLVAHYEYDPFGNRLLADGPHADQPFQWSTKQHHEPSGLVHYGYRFYAPQMGRWINRDPIGERGGEGILLFVENSAVNFIDPFGLSRQPPLPDEDSAPPNPFTCSQIRRWMNRYAVGFSDKLWKHWLAGTGDPVVTKFSNFDKNSTARNAIFDDLLQKGVDIAGGLSCGTSKTTLFKTNKPDKTNKYTDGVTRKMIYGWRFWYTCTVVSTKTCRQKCCNEAHAFCDFYAFDEVNFWPDDATGSSSFVIPGGIRIYDQWILDCFPGGKGFEVSANDLVKSKKRVDCVK